ncbi:MAG TPA: hypothetical protein VG890_15555 [Puia sp.]|nr:hypothetical protein [Puia sp.]
MWAGIELKNDGDKKIMTVKLFFIGLILSKILTAIWVALMAAHFEQGITFFQFLIVLLLSGTAEGVIMHLLLFCVYFFNIKLAVIKIASKVLFFIFLVLSGSLYFAIVTLVGWNISKDSFKDFGSYMSQGSYYSIYTLVVVLILIIIGIRSRGILQKTIS